MSDTDVLDAEAAEAFAVKCRKFLDEHAKGLHTDGDDSRSAESMAICRRFQKALSDAGLAGLTYPTEFGGAGLTKEHDQIFRSVYSNYPNTNSQLIISHGMCLPVLNEFGSEEQKREFLPGNISAETVWCQMFSEPGAGSDVASLQTKAELDGEEWIINGQKVWTTLAHVSDYGILVARTDPTVPKHSGISMFIVDMTAPGVEIRPIHQIDGGKHFNEVFFTDVRIPAAWQVGPLNEGWRLATAMLMYERVAIGTGPSGGVSTTYARRFIAEAKERGTNSDPVLRQELMKLYCAEMAKSLVSLRTRSEMQAGRAPGPGGSLGKLHGAVIAEMGRALVGSVIGTELTAWEPGSSAERFTSEMLNSFQMNIAGGTDQIQRNIIGDRVLGLPREPSADKGIPFNELKVGTQT